MIDGTKVRMGGKDWVLPPMNMKILRKHDETFKAIKGNPTPEQYASIINAVTMALQRNYPEVTEEQVEEMLDLGNYNAVLGALMSVSGLEKRSGEAQSP